MPTARESLLDAASAALGDRPWTAIRMVEVAAAAGVSRQTLYNEFHSKEGLARALARREGEAYLAGVDRVLALARRGGADAAECFAAAAGWTLRTARRSALVRAALTGAADPRAAHPQGGAAAGSGGAAAPAVLPDLVSALHARTVAALEAEFPHLRHVAGPQRGPGAAGSDIAWACEAAVRLTLSYVIAPAPSDEAACLRVAQLVRGLLS
ncbi:helix-turn-helix domain-containing protein [Streptomyces sp. V4-01]|uniref:Helix-turn-helix domain-containing protein n=1 Tax=Actinacidiphila polyblastidii TaxID=3110430 RepID=A0ABU7PBL9_9ACTN|nr:helix-turn-helix domain-containing protein [Streptomyces sp. V4-01]